jgi:hypothetical protein
MRPDFVSFIASVHSFRIVLVGLIRPFRFEYLLPQRLPSRITGGQGNLFAFLCGRTSCSCSCSRLVWMHLPPRGTSPGSHLGSHFALFRRARAFVTVLQVLAHANAYVLAAASRLHTWPCFAAAFCACTLLHHMSRAPMPRVFQQWLSQPC